MGVGGAVFDSGLIQLLAPPRENIPPWVWIRAHFIAQQMFGKKGAGHVSWSLRDPLTPFS